MGKMCIRDSPVVDDSGSDSAMFDNTLEFLHMTGRSLPHAIMMMIPEPWERNKLMSQEKHDFYEFNSFMMEPWDGPAAVSYTHLRGMLISEPEIWNRLMEKLADMSIEYLSMQARAGANALQIFDSWVGAVNSTEYEQAIFPHMKRIISTVKSRFPNLPLAMNGVGTDHLVSTLSLIHI